MTSIKRLPKPTQGYEKTGLQIFGESLNSAVSQNQLVVLFGLTWLVGLLIVTIALTQFP